MITCRAFVSARSELKYAIILSPFTFFLSLSTGVFLDMCPLILVTVQSLRTGGNGVEIVRPAMAPRVFCPPVHRQLANHRKSAERAGGVFRFCLQTRALGFGSFCPPGCLSTATQNRGRARWLSARHPALSPCPTPRMRKPPMAGTASSALRDPARPHVREAEGGQPPREGPEGTHFSAAPCTQSVLHGLLFNALKYGNHPSLVGQAKRSRRLGLGGPVQWPPD